MTSPVIDENVMMQALKSEGGNDIRTGATMLLLDAFDRKITRDQFIAALGAVVSLIDGVGKQEMMINVKEFFQNKGSVTAADIEVAMHSCQQIIEANVDQCVKMADLFHQMPLNEDKVH